MSNYQNFNKEQKEDLREVFKGMKLSIKESEKIRGGESSTGGGELGTGGDEVDYAWLCLSSSCNSGCNTPCISCVHCPSCGIFESITPCDLHGYASVGVH